MASIKGQITFKNVGAVFVTIVIAYMILVISTDVVENINDDFGSQSTLTTTNETVAANNTLLNVGTPEIDGNNIDNTTEVVHNETDAGDVQLTRSTHYELTTAGAFTLLPEAAGLTGTSSVNITYNSTVFSEDPEYNVSRNTLDSMVNLSGQFGNVGTVVGAALIIGVLLGAFLIGRIGGGISFK